MNNEMLYHHGVKGMKWGIRRYQNKDGTLTAAGRRRKFSSNADSKERDERRVAVKNRRSLSDAELKRRIERLKLEKEFKSLTEEDISPGRKFVSRIMSSAGTKALTIAAAGAMSYGVKAAMTGKFDVKEAASYIAANPNKKK